MWERSRSLAWGVVSYNWRSSVTWVSDKGGRIRGLAIVPFKEERHHTTPVSYRKYFLEAFSMDTPWRIVTICLRNQWRQRSAYRESRSRKCRSLRGTDLPGDIL